MNAYGFVKAVENTEESKSYIYMLLLHLSRTLLVDLRGRECSHGSSQRQG